MLPRTLFSFLAIVVFAAGSASLHVSASEPATIVIHAEQSLQTIESFGASSCWWAQEVGKWPDASRRNILELLYNAEHGIGLTLYRHTLGAGSEGDATIKDPLRRAESHLRADGKLDWSRDAAAVRVLHEAVAAGATQVVLFANSAPVSLTKNGHAYGDTLPDKAKATNLAPGQEPAFARYLVAAAEHFLRDEKLPVVALSPINEPEWHWNEPSQEGCHFSPAEAVAVLKATAAELRGRGLPVALAGPEDGSWKTARDYVSLIAADPELRRELSTLSFHSYFSDAAEKKDTRALLDRIWPEANVHMSEWCELKSGRDPGMESALVLARTVMEDLVIGRVSSWQCWLAATPYDYRDGLVQLEPAQRTGHATKRLWALGQFSRFLRPGAHVVSAEAPWSDARVVAARLADDRGVVLVCLNPEPTATAAHVKVAGRANARVVAAYVTDATRDLAPLPLDGRGDEIVLPPQSVSTFILAE